MRSLERLGKQWLQKSFSTKGFAATGSIFAGVPCCPPLRSSAKRRSKSAATERTASDSSWCTGRSPVASPWHLRFPSFPITQPFPLTILYQPFAQCPGSRSCSLAEACFRFALQLTTDCPISTQDEFQSSMWAPSCHSIFSLAGMLAKEMKGQGSHDSSSVSQRYDMSRFAKVLQTILS